MTSRIGLAASTWWETIKESFELAAQDIEEALDRGAYLLGVAFGTQKVQPKPPVIDEAEEKAKQDLITDRFGRKVPSLDDFRDKKDREAGNVLKFVQARDDDERLAIARDMMPATTRWAYKLTAAQRDRLAMAGEDGIRLHLSGQRLVEGVDAKPGFGMEPPARAFGQRQTLGPAPNAVNVASQIGSELKGESVRDQIEARQQQAQPKSKGVQALEEQAREIAAAVNPQAEEAIAYKPRERTYG
jgi:hypothetical protein